MPKPRVVLFDIGSTLWSSPAEDPGALEHCYGRGRDVLVQALGDAPSMDALIDCVEGYFAEWEEVWRQDPTAITQGPTTEFVATALKKLGLTPPPDALAGFTDAILETSVYTAKVEPPEPGMPEALADAIRRQDIGEAADTATPAAWGRDVQTLYQMARTRGQTLALAAAAVIDGERATVRCGLDQPRRPTARVTLMVTRDETGGWKVAGVASERAVYEAWRRGWIAAGMQYRDLPVSALGVAIAERIIATVASGGELAAALDDDSAGGLIAYPVLAKTLSGERKRVTALPAREHPTLGRLAVGFEIVDLATLGSDEIWLVLEDRGDGAKALATVSFMSLAMVLDDHGGGLPTPVSGRSEVPGAWRAPAYAPRARPTSLP